MTSRTLKPEEVNGHDFDFLIKEDFLKLIRNNQMIEWGEVNGHLYGTTADSVRQVIRFLNFYIKKLVLIEVILLKLFLLRKLIEILILIDKVRQMKKYIASKIYLHSLINFLRSGRVCLLDCTEKALKVLYAREFMPYIVVIAAPPYADLIHLNESRAQAENRSPPRHKDIQRICDENDKLLNGAFSKYFHLILINRNFDITLRRLLLKFIGIF